MSERSTWVILLIGLADWIEGATRVQKYAFLGARTVKGLTEHGFYDDWMPSKYGPFSPNLAEDLEALVNASLVGKYPVKNDFGYPVDRFALTEQGRVKFSALPKDMKTFGKNLQEIVSRYKNKTLMDLLHDVYLQFPEYAYSSTIRPQIAKKIFESDSYLNPQFDESED